MKRMILKSVIAIAAMTALGMATAQERTLKMNLNGPDNHPAAAGMKKFAESVAAKTNGRIKINLFYNGALGSDQSVVSALKGGTIELAVMNFRNFGQRSQGNGHFRFPLPVCQ